jgi:signal transduction histidine kinase
MATKDKSALRSGVLRLKQNPQLWWTMLMAVVIFGAFLYIANMFVTIAQDAQDRLINVRAGSIHDTLVQYIDDISANPEELNRVIANIKDQNQTIEEFRVVSVVQNENLVLASLDSEEIGQKLEETNRLTTFAFSDTQNSFTTEIANESERSFVTVRAFSNESGEIIGYIETRQTLSEADRLINENIRRSLAIFVGILALVMILFLRHAKIVDYVSLYKQLKEVGTLKDDFISMASHELKTPLSVIRGYAEFLRDSRELGTENKEYARRIDVSTKELTSLVEDMLDVSRIEQDRMKFEFVDVNVDSFVAEIIENLDLQVNHKGLKLNLIHEGDKGLMLKADVNRLRQIFVNLIGNAIKYTKEGEVTLKISAKRDKYIEFRISDTGIGMTQEEMSHLFEKFYRAQNTDTESVAGTGLGLWITKQIVEKMGGKISAESIKGKGTDFVVRFSIT